MKEIAEAQVRHAKVQTALEQATKTTQGHAQDLQNKEMRHVLEQVEELHRLDKEQVKKLHELAQESITMIGVSTHHRHHGQRPSAGVHFADNSYYVKLKRTGSQGRPADVLARRRLASKPGARRPSALGGSAR